MSSDNPSGAVNQQERPDSRAGWIGPRDLGSWVAGSSTEKEASTSRSVESKTEGCRGGLDCPSMSLRSAQAAPQLLRASLAAERSEGDVMVSSTLKSPRQRRSWRRCFRSSRVSTRTPKVGDLAIFRRDHELVQAGRHLTVAGFEEILILRAPMNRGGSVGGVIRTTSQR